MAFLGLKESMMADSASSPAHPGLFLPVLLAGVKKRWFIMAVLFVIACANAYPPFGAKSGPLMPEITIKYIAVIAIFFNSGISLKTEELTSAISQVRLHMFIQFYTLALIPMTVSVLLVPALQITNFVNPIFLKGLQVVSCMPPPVSSAVILTKSVGGNEAAAIFNSAMGSFLGIVVTPLLLLVFVGTTTTIPFLSIFTKLSLTVLFPLILGQVVRQRVKKWLEETNPPFGIISSLILLTIIYSTFCDTFNESDSHFSIGSTASIGVVVILTQVSFVGLAFLLSGLVQTFSKQDIIAVIFCATHKSLTLGIPIIKIVFGDSPELSGYSLPLLIYHPTQILLGSVLVPFLQEWIKKDHSTEQITSRSSTPSGKDKTTV